MKAFLKYAVPLLFSLLICTATSHAAVTNVIRNGDFSSGLSDWNINPALPSTWNPLTGGGVELHPSVSEFNGTIVYQNLNVTGIANIQFTLGFTLTKNYAPIGRTVAVYLDYVNSANQLVRVKAANPDNNTITSATPVSATYTFPADARKLVKIRVDKEAYGDFIIDNITLTGNGITVGVVPVITSISSDSGAYGASLTITGTGFGATQGSVRIGGSSGAAVTGWSNTSITATVNDPARSGPVVVVSDFTESNANIDYTVTSPNYTVDLMQDTLQVVKGQAAQFVIKGEFVNGFSAAAGIGFTLSGLPVGAVYSFAPVPLKRSGGVVLKIATASLTPGTFDLTITGTAATLAPRVANARLIVTTTGTLDFYKTDPVTYEQSIITALSVTKQGSIYGVNAIGSDSGQKPFTEIQISSNNPASVGVYKNAFGSYDIYAHNSGSATLTATAPDGVTKTLPVTVTMPTEPYVSLSLSPQSITNKYSGFINLLITFDTLAGQSQSITASVSGNVYYVEGSSTLDFPYPQTDPPTYGGHFKIDHTKTQLGSYIYGGSIDGGTASAANATPFIITNDPSYAGLDMSIKSLDSSLSAHMFEFFDIEFYNNAGTLLFTRSNTIFTMGDTFFIGAIEPGSYKMRFVPQSAQILPQWYPNADSAADAELITFTAGANNGPRYFFARKAPDTTPPIVTEFTLPSTSSTLTVTGIVLSGYDESGISAYCLTEVNNAAGCTWLVSSPTQYTFASSGAKTLYAFLKDGAGNISVTDGTSTKSVSIVLQFPLTLAFAGTGGGDVNGGMTCSSGEACPPVLFTEGAPVVLTANPDGNSTFGGWTGCNSVSGTTCNVTMVAAKTVTVTFTAVPPVKILGGSAAGFANLHLAYDAASSNASAPSTIQVRSVTLTDTSLSFDRAISVTVKGGYDKLFNTNTGISTIQGPITFKGGPVVIENLSVR